MMRISRLYVPGSLQVGRSIELNDDSAHYVRTVLRLKKGQALAIFNGQGEECLCELEEVSRKRVALQTQEMQTREVESPLQVHLGLGISRGDRMDWGVQKAVELGVQQITPLLTERSVVKLNEEKKQQRQQHWRNICQHAAEQSGRIIVPELAAIDELPQWVAQQQGLRIFLDPHAEQSLADLQPQNQSITLLSGPEGGFSEPEREFALASGFVPVRLGKRVLRTETAALAALAAVQTLWGDFC